MIGTDNSIGDYKETAQTQGINDAFVLRFKNKPKKLPLFKYLVVLHESESKINSKIPFFDIFSMNNWNTYKINLKQLKKLNRKNIGIEIKIREIRNCNSYEVGKWVKSIKEINKFCKLTDNQLIISSGAETNYETISGNTFDSLLRIFDIEPIKYWNELEKWIDTKSRVYYGTS
jgi:RNase P/RNase MRP subunit p30